MNRFGYRTGFPSAGLWREVFNSESYDGFPNPGAVGNAGATAAANLDWDGVVSASAALTLPASNFFVFAR
jgi:1,4-alpha-glucan branching enzyme